MYKVYYGDEPMKPRSSTGVTCSGEKFRFVDKFEYKTLKRIFEALRWEVMYSSIMEVYGYSVRDENGRIIAKVIPYEDKWDRYRLKFCSLTPGETKTIIKLMKENKISIYHIAQGPRYRYGENPNVES